MIGKQESGFSIIELLVVIAIIGVLSMALVPAAEISFIRLKEIEFEQNLNNIRLAISQWRYDCEDSVERGIKGRGKKRKLLDGIPDHALYPPDIGSLTKSGIYDVWVPDSTNPADGFMVPFNYLPYLREVPVDPFVGAPVWTEWLASPSPIITDAASVTFSMGKILPEADWATGVFDVSGHPATDTRRGFTMAIDGTYYKDW